MEPEVPPLKLSSGAAALLRIARQNDPELAMVKNVTLMIAMELALELFWSSPRKSLRSVVRALKVEESPTNFLELVSAMLLHIRTRAAEDFCTGQTSENISFATDFDRHVLHAFSLTLADLAWPDRSGDDFDGPPASNVVESLQKSNREKFFDTFVRNYIGDILQDYFSRTGVRRQHRGLPEDREVNLRLIDAQDIVEHMRASAFKQRKSLDSPRDLLHALTETLSLVK